MINKKFTKNQIDKMRIEIEEALDTIAKRYGSQANLGRITYGSSASMRLEFNKFITSICGDSYPNTKESTAFGELHYKHNIPIEALHNPFQHQGKEIVILGYSSRSSKYPIKYTQDGGNYKCSIDYMKKAVEESLPSVFL